MTLPVDERKAVQAVLDAERQRNALLVAELAAMRAERDAFNAMANLLATDNAFAMRTKGGGVGFNVPCSDTFAWACADCEAIDMSQAPEVWKLYQEGGWQAVALWVQEKRGGEKFIKPVEEMIERSKAILAERDATEAALRAMSRWAVLADREDPNVEAVLAMKGLRLWREPTGGES